MHHLSIEKIRNDFPILKTKTKGKPLIFLDNASTSQKPAIVIRAVDEFYKKYNSNIHRGLYGIAERATKEYEETRKVVADFIGAKDSAEIIFTSGTTEAVNLTAFSWGEKNVKRGDNIITTVSEHHSNFVPWQQLAKRKKANFLVSPILADGTIDQNSLLKLITNKAKLIAITYISNVLGTINPIGSIIQAIRKKNKNAKILIDGAQAVPHLPINVKLLDCDFLVFSGHKMLGPNGIGTLYAKREILENMPPFLYGGHMVKAVNIKDAAFNDVPWKFEAGTQNIAGVIGLKTAINYLKSVPDKETSRYLQEIAQYAVAQLLTIPGIIIYGKTGGKGRIGTVSFNIKGAHPHDLAQILGNNNICVRAGHHCAMPLHRALGIASSIRASFYIYNTKEEVEILKKTLLKARRILNN